MTDGSSIDPEPTARELALAEQLHVAKPVPAAGFRGALGRHLAARDAHYGTRPARLRLMVSGYLVASVLLIALGALQATGSL
jgi:hypothetical protein